MNSHENNIKLRSILRKEN